MAGMMRSTGAVQAQYRPVHRANRAVRHRPAAACQTARACQDPLNKIAQDLSQRASMLTIQNLSHVYSGGTRALNDVSLEIPAGIFGLLGPNGAATRP